jgi:hypothetical protein
MTLCITGLFWVLTHRIVDATTDRLLLASGVALVCGSLVLRLARHRVRTTSIDPATTMISECLFGLGLGVVTAAPVLMGLTGLVCLARWTGASMSSETSAAEQPSRLYDSLYVMGAVAAVGVIQALKGLVPLQ